MKVNKFNVIVASLFEYKQGAITLTGHKANVILAHK